MFNFSPLLVLLLTLHYLDVNFSYADEFYDKLNADFRELDSLDEGPEMRSKIFAYKEADQKRLSNLLEDVKIKKCHKIRIMDEPLQVCSGIHDLHVSKSAIVRMETSFMNKLIADLAKTYGGKNVGLLSYNIASPAPNLYLKRQNPDMTQYDVESNLWTYAMKIESYAANNMAMDGSVSDRLIHNAIGYNEEVQLASAIQETSLDMTVSLTGKPFRNLVTVSNTVNPLKMSTILSQMKTDMDMKEGIDKNAKKMVILDLNGLSNMCSLLKDGSLYTHEEIEVPYILMAAFPTPSSNEDLFKWFCSQDGQPLETADAEAALLEIVNEFERRGYSFYKVVGDDVALRLDPYTDMSLLALESRWINILAVKNSVVKNSEMWSRAKKMPTVYQLDGSDIKIDFAAMATHDI